MQRVFWGILLGLFWSFGQAGAATVQRIEKNDIYLDTGKTSGIQIGTIFNVYRNQEVDSGYGNMKFTTRIFIGRVYAFRVKKNETIARLREMSAILETDVKKAVLEEDLAEPAFVLPADEVFAPGKSDLLPEAVSRLDKMVRFIKRFKALKVRIEVHANKQIEGAMKVTRAQAESLSKWLTRARQINSNLLVPVGYGSQKPVGSHSTDKGQKANRRIEVVIEN